MANEYSKSWFKIFMKINSINTKRTIIMPLTKEIIKALMSSNTEELKKIGIKTNGKWPTRDVMDFLPMSHEELNEYGYSTGFEIWMIVRKEDMMIIGDIGFKGKPNKAGEIEVGYGLIEEEQGRGYGFEALQAIINWAFSQENVKKVKANCFINNKPSIHILEKVGMKETKRDNGIIYWEI